MTDSAPLTVQRVSELVLANRVIRSPTYHADQTGIRWGDDVVPALMGLFRVENDTRDDHPDGWVGFARRPRGKTFRLDFDLKSGAEWPEEFLVVTAISGREEEPPGTIVDENVGEIELPDEVPTEQEWAERAERYQAARRDDTADDPAAVKAYVAALPGWKREVATRIDEIIEREVPDVRRAVKWHEPFYGVEAEGWFASVSASSKVVKLTFLRGTSLEPVPPREHPEEARALDLTETDELDDEQVASWVRQAADIPGLWRS